MARKTKVQMELEDILERLARAEATMEASSARSAEWHSQNLQFQEKIDTRLSSLEQALAKYTGFWGAVVMISSAVVTFVMLTKDFLLRKLGVTS